MSEVQYTGHGENTGGLQQHSVGDEYPFTVIGTHHRRMDQLSQATRYYVLNCATGDRWYWKQPITGEIMTWPSISDAHMVAQWLKDGVKSPAVVRV